MFLSPYEPFKFTMYHTTCMCIVDHMTCFNQYTAKGEHYRVSANSGDKIRLLLKKQSDQGLRCSPFHQHLLDALIQCYIKLFYF